MTKRMDGGHYLTAVLQVIKNLRDKNSHQLVADHCESLGHALPSNCMVRNNTPLTLDKTGGFRSKGRETVAAVARGNEDEMSTIIRAWDGMYRKRIIVTPNVALTKPHYVELRTPSFLTDQHLVDAFGKVPYTLNPPKTTLERLNILLSSVGIQPVE
ncbi:hypothetical protein [Hymenobacter sp. DG01]|uniref:hypothetical protein n=1 Tax=Hymenobacter sp. DG01 TaxID=2584940 RepID=UPI00111F5901|nr:hypothetical protein [Hymenobacter sp. DG01]